jgi:asparagine synthase (glutamine-hydrolysing)
MCGIAGFWNHEGLSTEATACLDRLSGALLHRGPDGASTWTCAESGIALAHRRLSIVDLSPLGRQPMVSHDERSVLTFNGEIYNYRELRAELEAGGARFRGNSDTEVFLEGIARWGLRGALDRAAGMFAFAVWDRRERRLHLVRDRFGEKPLYYAKLGRAFAFASELKALKTLPGWHGTIDRGALTLFMRYNCVPAPYTIYENVWKVLPGAVLTVAPGGEWHSDPYWSLARVVSEGRSFPLSGTDAELTDLLDARLRTSIREQMVADVPLGALLSGGIDSTTVTAVMQAQQSAPVRTFSIGFAEAGYDEAPHARAIADHLGTAHTELYVTAAEAREVVPLLPRIYDEPFADSSQIPTFLVSRMARQHVTVALSGDGADEMLGGYNRYFLGSRIWGHLRPWPRAARAFAARRIRQVPPGGWGIVLGSAQELLPSRLRVPHVGDRMHKLADVLEVSTASEMYRSLVSHWREPSTIVLGGHEPPLPTETPDAVSGSFVEHMMYTDTRRYLPDDILVKVDRAAMAVSLESRAPFLDHRVAELAWRLPLSVKVRRNEGKWILKQVAYRYVPPKLLDRPKMGFGVPIDEWLRGPLRQWADDLLSPSRLASQGYFAPAPIAEKWREHVTGARNWQYLLWDVLMFESWLDAEPARDQLTPSGSA